MWLTMNLEIFVCFFCFFTKANSAKQKETVSLSIDSSVIYGDEKYLLSGTRKTITCKASGVNQKLEWVDPTGEVVKRIANHRVSAIERPQSPRVRFTTLVLNFTQLATEDTGEWMCMSNDMSQSVSLCVIGKVEFVDTPTEVAVDHGRSISLTCQARGNPEPKILWYRHGEIITDDTDPDKYKVMTKYLSQGFEGLLTVMSLEQADAGVYTCEAVQEYPSVDDCSATTETKVTLLVNHAPTFDKENETEVIFGEENEKVDLLCEAHGYPVPTYKWYADLGDTLSLIHEDKVTLQNNGTQAVITLNVDSTTSGLRYQCSASNIYGDAEKIFVVQKIEKPARPDEISVYNATTNAIQLNMTWNDNIVYVESVDIQYFDAEILFKRKAVTPTYADWRKGEEISVEPDQSDFSDTRVTIPFLEPNMLYYIRLRVHNSVGESTWSDSLLGATEVLEEQGESSPIRATYASMSDTTLYGIICGVVFILMAAIFICMRRLSKSS